MKCIMPTQGHWERYDATHGINGKVYAIQQDQDGCLWFATAHCGVARYDGTDFSHFTFGANLASKQCRHAPTYRRPIRTPETRGKER